MRKLKDFFSIVIVMLLAIAVISLPFMIKFPHKGDNGSTSEKPDESIEEPIETDYYTVTFDVGEYGVGGTITQRVKNGEKPTLFKPECKYKTECVTDSDWDGDMSKLDEDETEPLPIYYTVDDYEFKGWYNGAEKITADNCPAFNKDVTLIAHWVSCWTKNY